MSGLSDMRERLQADHPGASSDALITTRQRHRFVQDHFQALKVAIANYNDSVDGRARIDFEQFEAVFDAEVMSEESLDEYLSEARRGWDS